MDAIVRLLVERFGASNPDGLTAAVFFRMMRVCVSWYRLLAADAMLWRGIGRQQLRLRRAGDTRVDVSARMRCNARCWECGGVHGRPCYVGGATGRIVRVCRRCESDPRGFRRLLDRATARSLARHASDGMRRKGRNVELLFRTLPVARWTRSGGGRKTLYWAHQFAAAHGGLG